MIFNCFDGRSCTIGGRPNYSKTAELGQLEHPELSENPDHFFVRNHTNDSLGGQNVFGRSVP